MSSNWSFYAVPGAWLVAIVPHLMAVTAYDRNRAPGTPKWDNANPNEARANMKQGKLSPRLYGLLSRAEAAQQNSFINLPFFAAAIVAGNLANLPTSTLNWLAGGYLVSRVAFTLAYVFIADSSSSLVRTATYLGGIGINFALFIKSGNALNSRSLRL